VFFFFYLLAYNLVSSLVVYLTRHDKNYDLVIFAWEVLDDVVNPISAAAAAAVAAVTEAREVAAVTTVVATRLEVGVRIKLASEATKAIGSGIVGPENCHALDCQ
jgi:hypothetical protein